MHKPTARIILTDDNGSNVVFQKFRAPTTSTNVNATQTKTIKHILVSASSTKVIAKTQANARPKFLHSSKPKRKVF